MTPADPSESNHTRRSISAYNRMMERVKATLGAAEQHTLPRLRQSIAAAADVAEQLGELTRDEAQKIAYWLQRDLHDAGHYLATTGQDLRSWLRFDVELIEDRLLDVFDSVADRTRLEWLDMEERSLEATQYHSGEITGPGTLQCTACGHELHFHATGHIPPCPGCRGTVFMRVVEGG